jgi:hypothetical protein
MTVVEGFRKSSAFTMECEVNGKLPFYGMEAIRMVLVLL